jgi:hypothetical protein
VGGLPNGAVAFATTAEIILVSYLTMLPNFLSEPGMMEWAILNQEELLAFCCWN